MDSQDPTAQGLINSIVSFCRSRGEKDLSSWRLSMEEEVRNCPKEKGKQTVIALGFVKDRVERGEPLMVTPICPPFLDAALYASELSNKPFQPIEFEAAVTAIAELIRQTEQLAPLAVKRGCRQDTWKRLMLDGVEKHITKSGYVRAFIRKNLIDLAERVRNWEMLYHPEDLFKKAGLPIIGNEAPTNWLRVPTDTRSGISRSLGRISHRQAQRIGYEGQEAKDGGISF
ncbi:hypothetical protein JCM3765_001093 [Sporobolomyces pararoseus]